MRKASLFLGAFLALALGCTAYALINSSALQRDSMGAQIQSPPGFSLVDGLASAKTITNLALTGNVVTITTSATHGYVVGQQVVIVAATGPTLFADCNGTFIVATVNAGAKTFTYAFTHADITTGAATGTSTAYWVSQIPATTGEISLTFPTGAFHLVVVPTTANATLRKITGGATQGTFTLYSGVGNGIDGVEGDIVYIQRGSSTALEFVFDTTR